MIGSFIWMFGSVFLKAGRILMRRIGKACLSNVKLIAGVPFILLSRSYRKGR